MTLIDADNITGAKFHDLPYTHIVPRDVEPESYILGWNDAIDAIIEVEPTIDAVEVVRCKDCVHMHDNDCPIHWGKTENDYCSYGERGDSDDETGSD